MDHSQLSFPLRHIGRDDYSKVLVRRFEVCRTILGVVSSIVENCSYTIIHRATSRCWTWLDANNNSDFYWTWQCVLTRALKRKHGNLMGRILTGRSISTLQSDPAATIAPFTGLLMTTRWASVVEKRRPNATARKVRSNFIYGKFGDLARFPCRGVASYASFIYIQNEVQGRREHTNNRRTWHDARVSTFNCRKQSGWHWTASMATFSIHVVRFSVQYLTSFFFLDERCSTCLSTLHWFNDPWWTNVVLSSSTDRPEGLNEYLGNAI